MDDGQFAIQYATIAVMVTSAVLVTLLVLRHARLRPPDLEAWLHQNEQALESPPVAAAARSA